jgi:hypothetical protein
LVLLKSRITIVENVLIGHIDVSLLVDNIPVGVVVWHSYEAIEEIEKRKVPAARFSTCTPSEDVESKTANDHRE